MPGTVVSLPADVEEPRQEIWEMLSREHGLCFRVLVQRSPHCLQQRFLFVPANARHGASTASLRNFRQAVPFVVAVEAGPGVTSIVKYQPFAGQP